MSTPPKRLGPGWRLSVALFSHRRLLMGIFSDEFLFHTEEKRWLFGRYRLENESRVFLYLTTAVVGADLRPLPRAVSENEERQLVAYLDHIARRHGPLEAP